MLLVLALITMDSQAHPIPILAQMHLHMPLLMELHLQRPPKARLGMTQVSLFSKHTYPNTENEVAHQHLVCVILAATAIRQNGAVARMVLEHYAMHVACTSRSSSASEPLSMRIPPLVFLSLPLLLRSCVNQQM